MARRRESERTFSQVNTIASGSAATIVAAASGFIIKPKAIVAHSASSTQLSIKSNGVVWLSAQTDIEHIVPDGFELPRSSGLEIENTGATAADTTVYYCLYDERTPITKEEARLATYIPSNATATRTPNEFGNQSKT